jgi:DNA-binding XRE family transcriptional regulator
MSPGARARSDAKTQKMIEEMALNELRQAMGITQERLAKALRIDHAGVSKIESRSDIFVKQVAQSHRGDGWNAGDSREVPGWRSADSRVWGACRTAAAALEPKAKASLFPGSRLFFCGRFCAKASDQSSLGRSTAAPQTPSRQQGPEPPVMLRNYDADAAAAGQYGISLSANLPSEYRSWCRIQAIVNGNPSSSRPFGT